MLRAIRLRYAFIAVLVFSAGTTSVTSAAILSHDTETHRQDIGDDDNDGILNYLDPDDNNDGVLDKDTPAPTKVPLPTPIPTQPIVSEVPAATETPTAPPAATDTPTATSPPAVTETPTAAPGANNNQTGQAVSDSAETLPTAPAVVSSLPNTGSGSSLNQTVLIPLFSAIFSVVAFASIRWHRSS